MLLMKFSSGSNFFLYVHWSNFLNYRSKIIESSPHILIIDIHNSPEYVSWVNRCCWSCWWATRFCTKVQWNITRMMCRRWRWNLNAWRCLYWRTWRTIRSCCWWYLWKLIKEVCGMGNLRLEFFLRLEFLNLLW